MISIIAAIAENNCIGINNKLPWHLPGDLKNFARLTSNKTVVMGMNTYKSIVNALGKSLPNRTNIILTFEINQNIKERQMKSWEEVRKLAETEEVFVIGGGSVYKQALDFANRLYITRVHAKPFGDTFFPPIELNKWELKSSQPAIKQPNDECDYTFEIYERQK